MEPITIRMLGEFSLQSGQVKLADNSVRTRKVWQLLSYLICHRDKPIPPKRLIELLWGDDPSSSSPENTLRITFHRARTMLNALWPSAGHELILHRDAGYAWNTEVPATVDFEDFERLCLENSGDAEQDLQNLLDALALYGGDFLEKQAAEAWVIPITAHFHNLFITGTMQAAEMLIQRSRGLEAAELCRKAILVEPYHEPLYQLRMRSLASAGDPEGAAAVYTDLTKRLFDDFGIRPSEETREIYRQTAHAPKENALPMDEVLEDLQEPNFTAGALQCDYDYFKVLCFAETRAMERNGNVTHVVLLSVTSGPEKTLTRQSLNRIMEQLGEQIRLNLRRGDTFSRCSTTQYILMLPHANYENSCMVCRRVLGAFSRRHPHIKARIHFMVQPLTPHLQVP